MKQSNLDSLKEQIQEDILSYAECIDPDKKILTDRLLDEICTIVVDNFKKSNDALLSSGPVV